MKKNCRRQIKTEFRVKKIIRRKGDKLCFKWKSYDNLFNSWIDKKTLLYKISQYFPKSCECFDRNVKLDLFHYTVKADLKGVTGVHTSNLAAKSDLARLKGEVDKDQLRCIKM